MAGHGGQVTIDIVWPSFDPEWRIWGLAGRLIRDTSPALPQYEGYVTRWSFALLRAFCSILLYSVFCILYRGIALFRWMKLGAAASDRGRRYCVKGSASTSQLCMCVYVAGLPGSIEALRLNIFWQEKLGLSSTYMYPIYAPAPFLTTSLVNSCPRNSAAANKHTGNWINHGIQSAPPIILNKPLVALSANFKNIQVVVKGDE